MEALGVFPARAGMSPDNLISGTNQGGVPRASGDEPYVDITHWNATSCSPRERG